MNTMTIHADDAYAMALRAYAERIGKSISQTVQILTAPSKPYSPRCRGIC